VIKVQIKIFQRLSQSWNNSKENSWQMVNILLRSIMLTTEKK